MARVSDILESARNEVEAGNRSLAVSYLNDACDAAGSDVDVWEEIGGLFMRIHEDESALRCLQRASRLVPRHNVELRAHLAVLRGMCLHEMCLFDREERAYLSSVELAPTPRRYVLLGRCQRASGRLVAARNTLRRAMWSYPDDEDVLFHYGFVLAESRPEMAIRVLRRLVLRSPESYQGYAELGYAMIWGGRLADAECTLRRILTIDEHRLWPYLYLAVCLAERNKPLTERYATLQRAREVYPSTLGTLLLGDLFLEWGREQDARKCYAEYLSGKWALIEKTYSMEDLCRGDRGFYELRRWRLVVVDERT